MVEYSDISAHRASDNSSNNMLTNLPNNVIQKVQSENKHEPMVSVIMAYHNRIEQIKVTLESISNSKYTNFEVIIIDDASENFHSIEKIINLYNFNIKLLVIDKSQKRWINPCIAYNLGFKIAQGEIIIIQNPEVVHVGDVISYTVNNIKDKSYFVYSVYSSPSFKYNRYFYSMNNFDSKYIMNNFVDKIDCSQFKFDYEYYKNKYSDIGNMDEKNALQHWKTIGQKEGRQCNLHGVYYVDSAIKSKGWYNNPKHNNRPLNFLSAIKKNDLNNIGGFDPIFKNGLWYDDDDFLNRIKKISTVTNTDEKNVFGVHLYHDMGSDDLMKTNNFESLRLRNRKFKKRNDKNPVIYRDIGPIDDFKKYILISNSKNNNIVIE